MYDTHTPQQATNEVLRKVPEATAAEMAEATKSSQAAFKEWKNTTPLTRQRKVLDLQAAVRDNQEKLAVSIVEEQGKVLADARGDVLRGLQVVEHACSIPTLLQGETLGNVATEMDMYSYRVPLGVTAGICPFNFPAMIPLWV